VPAQIAVLLALTAELFDPVPIDQMTDAERAVHAAAATIPTGICARFETAKELNDEDRKAIIVLARQSLAPFQPKPELGPEAKVEPKQNTRSKPDGATEVNPTPETNGNPKGKAGVEEKS
jgi:F-type H+-transporting ATPase subunit alpha